MNEYWVPYIAESDDGLVGCAINIAFANEGPDALRPTCTRVIVPFREPGEHGLGDDDEVDRIREFESALDEAGAAHGSMRVAALRFDGEYTMIFYGAETDAGRFAQLAPKVCKGYDVEVLSDADPEWSLYHELLPSQEAIDQAADANLISYLESLGDQNETPRSVDHALFFATPEEADQFRAAAADLGFGPPDRSEVDADEPGDRPAEGPDAADEAEDGEAGDDDEVEADDDDPAILVEVSRVHAIDLDTVTEIRRELTELAESFGGRYDGWQTKLVK